SEDDEDLRGATQDRFNGGPAAGESLEQRVARAGIERREMKQTVNVDAIRDVGWHTAGRRMRMEEKPLVLQVAHGVANGSRRNAEAEPAGNESRSRRFCCFHVRLDDRCEHAPLAFGELFSGHKLKASNDFRPSSSCQPGHRGEASQGATGGVGRLPWFPTLHRASAGSGQVCCRPPPDRHWYAAQGTLVLLPAAPA